MWVGLPTAAANFTPGEGGGGATALVLLVSDDGSVNNSPGGLRRGRLEVEVGLPDLLSGEGEDWEGGELGGDGKRLCRLGF